MAWQLMFRDQHCVGKLWLIANIIKSTSKKGFNISLCDLMHVEIGISKLIGFIEGGRGEVNPIRHVQGNAREEYGRKPRHDAFVAMRAVVMIVVIVVMVVMVVMLVMIAMLMVMVVIMVVFMLLLKNINQRMFNHGRAGKYEFDPALWFFPTFKIFC